MSAASHGAKQLVEGLIIVSWCRCMGQGGGNTSGSRTLRMDWMQKTRRGSGIPLGCAAESKWECRKLCCESIYSSVNLLHWCQFHWEGGWWGRQCRESCCWSEPACLSSHLQCKKWPWRLFELQITTAKPLIRALFYSWFLCHSYFYMFKSLLNCHIHRKTLLIIQDRLYLNASNNTHIP